MTRIFWIRHGPTHANGMVGWSDLPADLSDSARQAFARPIDNLSVTELHRRNGGWQVQAINHLP